ncbi:MAG: DNA polymerase III subunit gamma/tau [Candidatus Harrisonbacteria bacterium]|nr:DNA polymerase III subunit gamma/tau [Candidatus Harrisonbacteria bacterium]
MSALYRKYRPQKFSDLLGQSDLVTVMINTTKLDRFAHAYIFYGTRGTGKTSVARLVAKTANCTDLEYKKKHGEACDACDACMKINQGVTLDIFEIDGASNRGIDEIRELKEKIRVSPAFLRYKIFIIDEAHMLTTPAWNALLKVFEEPPAHAIFILATTEFEKIPKTILSRAQRYFFKPQGIKEISEKLLTITKEEKINADKDALELIATFADGSFRDAESLLDQLRSLAPTLTKDVIEEALGRLGPASIRELALAICKNDLKNSLALVKKYARDGVNFPDLIRELIELLRLALTLHLAPALESDLIVDFGETESAIIKELATLCLPEKISPLLKGLIAAYEESGTTPFPQLSLELALIENIK